MSLVQHPASMALLKIRLAFLAEQWRACATAAAEAARGLTAAEPRANAHYLRGLALVGRGAGGWRGHCARPRSVLHAGSLWVPCVWTYLVPKKMDGSSGILSQNIWSGTR